MSEFEKQVKATCDSCKNTIIVDDESFFGQDAICPKCDSDLYIPLPETDELEEFVQSKQNDSYSSNTKRCPFCKEIIQKSAIKCKHCGEMLNGEKRKKGKIDTEIIGIIGLILPAMASAFAYYWISQMRLLDNPSEKLMFIAGGTIGLTAILFAIEASLLGIGSKEDKTKSGKSRSGPVSWFLFCLLSWIIGFPAYLYWRSRYGLKNYIVGGILIAIIFLGTISFLNLAIESSKTDIREKLNNIKKTFSTDYSYQSSTSEKTVVTLSEYKKLSNGISYGEAVRIIGEDGEELSRNKMEGISGVMDSVETVMYSWQNSNGSNMNAMFQNDKLMQKAQFGLK